MKKEKIMVLFILGFILLTISIIMFVLLEKNKIDSSWYGFAFPLIIVSLTAILVTSVAWGTRNGTTREQLLEYNLLSDTINLCTKETSIIVLSDLLDRCSYMDEIIDRNSRNYDSAWVGIYYSKEIGKLEKLSPKLIEKLGE